MTRPRPHAGGAAAFAFWVCALVAIVGSGPAMAQELTLDLGDDSLSGRAIQLIALITVLSSRHPGLR